jgi:hypothetical protein
MARLATVALALALVAALATVSAGRNKEAVNTLSNSDAFVSAARRR